MVERQVEFNRLHARQDGEQEQEHRAGEGGGDEPGQAGSQVQGQEVCAHRLGAEVADIWHGRNRRLVGVGITGRFFFSLLKRTTATITTLEP